MAPKLTDELRAAIDSQGGRPVRIEDDATDKAYWLVDEDDAPEVLDRWLRHELQKGFDAADRGEIVEWDPDRIKAEGRRRLAQSATGFS